MNRHIGVLDSGIGGLTVVKELQRQLPGEDIVYFGDNRNCPYGNRSEEEILSLTMDMLEFMKSEGVKIVAIACNTISTLIDSYKDKYDFPIIDIIRPTVDHIINMNTYNIAIIATEFTIKTGAYEKQLLKKNSDINIINEGSKLLAGLVDAGKFDDSQTKEVIETHINNMSAKGDLYNLVLGCTHFPIVEDVFLSLAPELNIINPAFQQAKAIRQYLHKENLLNDKEQGSLDIYTSGDTEVYSKVIERLNLKNIKGITTHNVNKAAI
ncbi:glutamate racemase [Tissierella sp. Yu-01]|uniref:glutamate racemase n=1 Tax=Tissierella sp. Yu-01 TaxID=3035694 RepID=UPI00240E70EB|nr:glutamate racemase [Tissierella sp. Yu-01]WFA08367.1 glutamate racemase [Tissierella sp. Yu-01]